MSEATIRRRSFPEAFKREAVAAIRGGRSAATCDTERPPRSAATASRLNASGKLRRLIVSSDIVTSRPFSLSEVSTKAGQAHVPYSDAEDMAHPLRPSLWPRPAGRHPTLPYGLPSKVGDQR